MEMSSLAVFLGIVLAILIFVSVVLSFFMLINGSLSRRSVCYTFMVLCISGYSVIGYLYTVGNDEIVTSRTFVYVAGIVLNLMLLSIFMAFLSLLELSKKDFILASIFATIPLLVLMPRYFLSGHDMEFIVMRVDGESHSYYDAAELLYNYIQMAVYGGAGLIFAFMNMRSTRNIKRVYVHAKIAFIGGIFAFIAMFTFQLLLEVIPYAHSISHIMLFVVVFSSFRAFAYIPDEGGA